MWVMENLAYFDNAATTFPKPECVYTAMDAFARTNGVSLGRGQHVLSASASALADNTRELLLELFHCSNKKVVFTNTATEALNIIIKVLVYQMEQMYTYLHLSTMLLLVL